MSIERSRSLSKTPPIRRAYPLKMETIPSSSSYSELKDAHMQETGDSSRDDNQAIHREEEEYSTLKPNVSSFETDDDFKFKRHKNKHINGVPSLGERLDNLQDIKRAKWVDNFNSSMPIAQEKTRNNISSPMIQTSQLHPEEALPPPPTSLPAPAAPYMPYMYYYPMPSPAHPMMPFMGSPMHPSQLDGSHYVNSSVSIMPNSSLQPFFPPAHQSQQNGDTPQLLPPPPLYPYNFLHSQQQPQRQQELQQDYVQKSRNRRKSIAVNRGRRLSMLASQDDQHAIISPHKDVPEEDFYRHIGNTSFGKGLQIRQLFNWCIIRSLRNLENEDSEKQHPEIKRKLKNNGGEYVDPRRIALVIMKEFVNDIRKGTVDIDWEAEEESIYEDEAAENGEDTELRELFDDDDDEISEDMKNLPRKSKRNRSRTADDKRPKIPNSKNVENEKNLESLEGKVDAIKEEIKGWAEVLDSQTPETEWRHLSEEMITSEHEPEIAQASISIHDIRQDLVTRMDQLHIHAHMLSSNAQALSELSTQKIDKLSHHFVSTVNCNLRQVNAKNLLKGLSKSLAD